MASVRRAGPSRYDNRFEGTGVILRHGACPFAGPAEEESLDVSMEVSREGEPVFYLRCRCTTGMIFQCNLGGYNWSIQVGTGPWS